MSISLAVGDVCPHCRRTIENLDDHIKASGPCTPPPVLLDPASAELARARASQLREMLADMLLAIQATKDMLAQDASHDALTRMATSIEQAIARAIEVHAELERTLHGIEDAQ